MSKDAIVLQMQGIRLKKLEQSIQYVNNILNSFNLYAQIFSGLGQIIFIQLLKSKNNLFLRNLKFSSKIIIDLIKTNKNHYG